MKSFLIALLLMSNFSYANDVSTGNYWNEECNGGTAIGYTQCLTYTMGVIEGVRAQAGMSSTKPLFCMPETATYGQSADVFRQYLKNNPQKRHERAPRLVVLSMMAAFPCK